MEERADPQGKRAHLLAKTSWTKEEFVTIRRCQTIAELFVDGPSVYAPAIKVDTLFVTELVKRVVVLEIFTEAVRIGFSTLPENISAQF